ncbi:magnesium transporter CorA family protein [Paenibacillus sp. IB182496]|uniref:Magnesium transporter CorA family protein n=1 Tax=Paenibacillus sabuli TaxID=2772509 RepID=A0A927BQK6_9BACL|nr:magnesium transporter CorA family protein [Paenibacillus sabuli]MBD2844916.1 magnesium transporter CorA family protein [Paenibacillus sabuli]
MSHRMLQYAAGWTWQTVVMDEAMTPTRTKQLLPAACAGWVDEAYHQTDNRIGIGYRADGLPFLYGTLRFQASEASEDMQHLHYRLSAEALYTLHDDPRLLIRLQQPQWEDKLQACEGAISAFFIILTALLDPYHAGLDRFEARLAELESHMQHRNHKHLIDRIFERRYELLHWRHLYIPVKELEEAAQEAFLDAAQDEPAYTRLRYKLQRIETLLSHYHAEIETLISMDDATASFRGNDIMRTLTIFTVLCTPATVAGALWGMNFEAMPWLGEPWGFATICGAIALVTLLVFFWLWRKGWTGDILKGSKPAKPQKRESPVSNARILPPRKSRLSRSRRGG